VSRTVSEIRRLIGRKSPIRAHPTLIQRHRSGWSPSNFGMIQISPDTRMMGLPYGEEIMIVGRTMWTQSMSVTDRQTDGRTDRRTELLSQIPCNAERRTVKMLRPHKWLWLNSATEWRASTVVSLDRDLAAMTTNCAIAKMTAQCGLPWKFSEFSDYAHGYYMYSQYFSWDYFSVDPMNVSKKIWTP